MDLKFKNKVAVVTGGASGIGRCLTQEFVKQGASIAFIDMNMKAAEENVKLIKEMGGDVFLLWRYF